MDLNNTNSCFACTPAELTKAADLTTTIIKTNVFLREGQKKATDLGVIIVKTKVFMAEEKKKATTPAIIIKTWGDPGGELVKPCHSVLPLMSKFRIWSEFGTMH